MKYINSFRDGMHISGIYLCKNRQIQLTKNGKEYCSVLLQDKTGCIDGKIWDLGNMAISDFEAQEYVDIDADVTVFNNTMQLNIKRIRRAGEDEYVSSDYLPVSSRDMEEMTAELKELMESVKNKDLRALLKAFFEDDGEFIAKFRFSSAAKSVHHGFVGGLMEHSISVARICEFLCTRYGYLNKSLLITAALLHDVGKTRELLPFPENDYSDEGNYIGHIVIGYEMIKEKISGIPDFPEKLASQLEHCILSHHGELEYGSPKKPATAEAVALSHADNMDAKVETMKEAFEAAGDNNGWLGYNRLFETNIRKTIL